MPTRFLFVGILLVILATPALAEETRPETSIQLYKVADLVSFNTLQETAEKKISADEWQAQHPEAVESLDRLARSLKNLSSTPYCHVEIHQETLSLIVRNTAEGHRDVEQLLKSLRAANQPTIQVTCEPICAPDGERIKSLTDDKRQRAGELLMKKTLTADEAQEVRDLLKEPGYEICNQTVQLVSGRKSSWGISVRPAMVTACESPNQNAFQLRVDYVVDDITDKIPVGSQVFHVKDGESVISHHMCDGATVVWLMTPTRIPPGQGAKLKSNAQAKNVPNTGHPPN